MVSENVYDVAAGAPKQLPVSPHSEQAPRKFNGAGGSDGPKIPVISTELTPFGIIWGFPEMGVPLVIIHF